MLSTIEEIREHEWYQTRPQVIKDMIEANPPFNIYKFTDSGHHCQLVSYNENGTLTVQKTGFGAFIPALNQYQVFGVKPEDLEVVGHSNDLAENHEYYKNLNLER